MVNLLKKSKCLVIRSLLEQTYYFLVEDIQIQTSKKPHYTFFLFVNPTSGGNKAAIFTKLDVKHFEPSYIYSNSQLMYRSS